MVFAVCVSLIWLFNPSILHALLQEGCERKKETLSVGVCFYTAEEIIFRLFWQYYYHSKNLIVFII